MFRKKFKKDLVKSRVNSFKYAINGITSAFKSEANMKIHIFITILVFICGFVFKISLSEWFICIILCSLVIAGEIFNTAIEEVVNIASPEIRPKAKLAKDLAAGGVLVLACTAFIVGLIIFVPKLSFLF